MASPPAITAEAGLMNTNGSGGSGFFCSAAWSR